MDEKQEEDFNEDIELTGEDNPLEPEIEEIEEQEIKKIKKIKEQLKLCEKEKTEHLEDLQRTKAEFLNRKQRLEEDKKRDKERAENKLVEKLLPLADSFHMAMHDKDAWGAIDKTWRKGIESIHSQLHNILESYGVSEIDPSGQMFDPKHHEAMTTVVVDDPSLDHQVVTVIQNGFIRKVDGKEELLRPARVTIGEYTEKETD